MKKLSLCIGVFVILFLAVGVYAARAQADLRPFDGTWVQMTMKPQKGVEFTGYNSPAAPKKMNAGAEKVYVCMNVEPTVEANEFAFLTFFDKTGAALGFGYLYWDAGTDLDFVGWMCAYTAGDVTYVAADYGPTDTYMYGPIRVIGKAADKVKFQSMGGTFGSFEAPEATATTGDYAVFGVTINGTIAKGKNIPSADCGWATLEQPIPMFVTAKLSLK